MTNNKVFAILQVSLVAEEQLSLFESKFEDSPQGKQQLYRAVFSSIIQKRKIVKKAKTRENVLLFNKQLSRDLVYFQLARQKEKQISSLIDNRFEASTVDDFSPIDIFVNLRLQQILIEIKERTFSVNEAVSFLTEEMRNIAEIENYNVYVSLIEDPKEFWSLIKPDNADEILEIKFEMIAPNFFGNIGQAKDLVNAAKKNVNADEVSIVLINKKGKLKASMEYLDSFVKYSSSAGKWELKIRKNDHIKIFKSEDTMLKKQISEKVINYVKKISEENLDNVDKYNKCIEEIENLFIVRE